MSSLAPHTAKSLVFGCIDDRLCAADAKFIASLEGGAFHPNLAGGGAAFLGHEDQASALKQVVAAYKINQIKDIYLQSHTDCGAYRLAGVTFADATAELTRLYSDLDQASQLVAQALQAAGAAAGEVSIHTRVVDPSGQIQPRPEPASA